MNITIEHDGETYTGVVMRIKSTHLGNEDHGIFTSYLHCEGAGTGVGVGGYGLDAWDETAGERVGHAFGIDHIKAVLHTVGVGKWEDLPGQNIVILHEGTSVWGSIAKGIASLMGDRVLIFEKHAEAVRERLAEVTA